MMTPNVTEEETTVKGFKMNMTGVKRTTSTAAKTSRRYYYYHCYYYKEDRTNKLDRRFTPKGQSSSTTDGRKKESRC